MLYKGKIFKPVFVKGISDDYSKYYEYKQLRKKSKKNKIIGKGRTELQTVKKILLDRDEGDDMDMSLILDKIINHYDDYKKSGINLDEITSEDKIEKSVLPEFIERIKLIYKSISTHDLDKFYMKDKVEKIRDDYNKDKPENKQINLGDAFEIYFKLKFRDIRRYFIELVSYGNYHDTKDDYFDFDEEDTEKFYIDSEMKEYFPLDALVCNDHNHQSGIMIELKYFLGPSYKSGDKNYSSKDFYLQLTKFIGYENSNFVYIPIYKTYNNKEKLFNIVQIDRAKGKFNYTLPEMKYGYDIFGIFVFNDGIFQYKINDERLVYSTIHNNHKAIKDQYNFNNTYDFMKKKDLLFISLAEDKDGFDNTKILNKYIVNKRDCVKINKDDMVCIFNYKS